MMVTHDGPALFPLGRVRATPTAVQALEAATDNLSELLIRHQTGDWGNADPLRSAVNDWALATGEHLTSLCPLSNGRWLLVVTDRKAGTTIDALVSPMV